MARIELTEEQLKQLVTDKVEEFLELEDSFTAYDITKALREDSPMFEIRHSDLIRQAVSDTVAADDSDEWYSETRPYTQDDGSVVQALTYYWEEYEEEEDDDWDDDFEEDDDDFEDDDDDSDFDTEPVPVAAQPVTYTIIIRG